MRRDPVAHSVSVVPIAKPVILVCLASLIGVTPVAFAARDAVGTWELSLIDPEATAELTIEKRDDGTLAGYWTSRPGERQIADVKSENGRLTFVWKVPLGGREVQLAFDGVVEGDKLTGFWNGPAGKLAVTGTRVATGAPAVPERQQAAARSSVPGIHVPEEISPVRTVTITAEDGHTMEVAIRMPPGNGPFPAVIVLHGGMSHRNIDRLVAQSNSGALCTRLLAAGYAVVVSTYRSYEENSRDPGPISDNVAVVDYLKKMPQVDNESIVVAGNSGGGRLALELSGLGRRTGLAAIACGEPATTLYAEMYPEGTKGPNMEVSRDLDKYFRSENAEILRRKVSKLSTPILIVHSDRHHINILNNLHLVPAIRAAGKDLKTILYPGFAHSFIWGRGVTKEAHQKLVSDLNGFFSRHVRVKPEPIALSGAK